MREKSKDFLSSFRPVVGTRRISGLIWLIQESRFFGDQKKHGKCCLRNGSDNLCYLLCRSAVGLGTSLAVLGTISIEIGGRMC
jgi:hypothetical protein